MVSEADLETESADPRPAAERFPEDGFLGEETGHDELAGAAGIWVVDPIDGTQPFVSGHEPAGACRSPIVAARHASRWASCSAPARDELFVGRRGAGATLNGRPIRVSAAAGLDRGHRRRRLLAAGPPRRSSCPCSAGCCDAGGMFYRDGSGALTLCYVACGRLIGYVEPHINSWDCLGALAVIEAAGGRSNDFLADDGLMQGNRLIAGSPGLYPALVALFDAQPS